VESSNIKFAIVHYPYLFNKNFRSYPVDDISFLTCSFIVLAIPNVNKTITYLCARRIVNLLLPFTKLIQYSHFIVHFWISWLLAVTYRDSILQIWDLFVWEKVFGKEVRWFLGTFLGLLSNWCFSPAVLKLCAAAH
jgi:hypothetical protein